MQDIDDYVNKTLMGRNSYNSNQWNKSLDSDENISPVESTVGVIDEGGWTSSAVSQALLTNAPNHRTSSLSATDHDHSRPSESDLSSKHATFVTVWLLRHCRE